MHRRGEVARLILFCATAILGAALLVSPLRAKKESFDKETFARLRERNPDIVLIGDSLLGYAIDPKKLESISGKRVELLWYGGAASAAWFLYLKNFVNASAIRPHHVFLFVHDDVLTNPRFRTTGKYAQELQRLMTGNDPVFQALAGPAQQWWLQRWIAAFFPADANRAHYQQKLDAWVRRVVALHRETGRQLEVNANAMFDLPNVRPDQPIVTSNEQKPFAQTVESSFLPHIIATARAGNYPLTFVRPRKRAGLFAEYDDSDAMRSYYAALAAYLQTNQCDLLDMTHDPAVTPDMFSDAVHIGPWATAQFTSHFAEVAADKLK